MVADFSGKVTLIEGPFENKEGRKSMRVTVFDGVETTPVFMLQSDVSDRKLAVGSDFKQRVKLSAFRDKLQVSMVGA